jgi:hypothetical protein
MRHSKTYSSVETKKLRFRIVKKSSPGRGCAISSGWKTCFASAAAGLRLRSGLMIPLILKLASWFSRLPKSPP